MSPKDVQPGTIVLILRLNTVIPCPAGDSIHGDKDRHLPCASAALWLELMPVIILFRDCMAISFPSLPLSCVRPPGVLVGVAVWEVGGG